MELEAQIHFKTENMAAFSNKKQIQMKAESLAKKTKCKFAVGSYSNLRARYKRHFNSLSAHVHDVLLQSGHMTQPVNYSIYKYGTGLHLSIAVP